MSWLDDVKWNEQGLVPAIAFEKDTQRVLTLAWMNRAALEATVAEKRAVYWSRSRGQLWRKGEQSGHVQRLSQVRLDCDGDTVLLEVEQIGGIACHTGRAHCFYRRLIDGEWVEVDKPLKDPASIYR